LAFKLGPVILASAQLKLAWGLLIPLMDVITGMVNLLSMGLIWLTNKINDAVEATKE
jgi:hypothetical protein